MRQAGRGGGWGGQPFFESVTVAAGRDSLALGRRATILAILSHK